MSVGMRVQVRTSRLVSAIPFSSLLLPAKRGLSIPIENGKREKKKHFQLIQGIRTNITGKL
jgi:hypothetical protein